LPLIDNDDDSDIVTLQPFMDYINTPELLVALMHDQGQEEVAEVIDLEPLGGGSQDNNYKGYIVWNNGTETKVQVKGSRSSDTPPASYREALFYSRICTMP